MLHISFFASAPCWEGLQIWHCSLQGWRWIFAIWWGLVSLWARWCSVDITISSWVEALFCWILFCIVGQIWQYLPSGFKMHFMPIDWKEHNNDELVTLMPLQFRPQNVWNQNDVLPAPLHVCTLVGLIHAWQCQKEVAELGTKLWVSMSWQIEGTTNCCSQNMFCIVVYMINPYSLCVCYCSCWVSLWTVALIKQKHHTHVWFLPWHFLKEHPI